MPNERDKVEPYTFQDARTGKWNQEMSREELEAFAYEGWQAYMHELKDDKYAE